VAESLISYFLITEVFHPAPQGPGLESSFTTPNGGRHSRVEKKHSKNT